MKLTKLKLFRYSIPLKAPVKLAKTVLHKREGLILQITNDSGQCGFGEIAPFPGFSPETLSEAESVIKSICSLLTDGFSTDELRESIEGSFSSVRFGVESALLNLEAKTKNVRICDLLSKSPRQSISINGLLTGTPDEILKRASEYNRIGYSAVKLKVGSMNVRVDIEITKQVRKAIGDEILLRLDANRAWEINDARYFCDAVKECNIDYLEEPLADANSLMEVLKSKSLVIPIALDETTREITPDELTRFDNVKAIVLKPTLLGLEMSLQFAKRAYTLGITPVIGSSFESGLGLSILAHMAAGVNTLDIPAGLDTYSWFAEDVIEGPLLVKKGRINIDELPNLETVLNSRLLNVITLP